MAINKKLISFATQAQFDVKLNAGDIDNRSIVFIEDKKRIWTHGVFFDTSWDFVTGTPDTLDGYGITDAAKKINSLYYVEGNTTGTAGSWTGSIPEVTSLYAGLTIAYKIGVAGASTTNLNLNGLGNKLVRRNTSNLTTHLPVGTVVLLTYDGTRWVWADYHTNTTYAAMSVAEGKAGTVSTLRTMRADYLKQIVEHYIANTAPSAHTHDYLPLSGGKLTGDLEIFAANTDKFIKFAYNTTDAYAWRIGYLGTGAGNENRLAFQSAKTSGTSYVDALSFGLDDLVGRFAVTPTVGNTKVSLEGHNHTLKLIAGASTATTNSTADVADPYIRLFSDNTHQGNIQIVGGTNVGVVSKNGVITFTSTNTTYSAGTLALLQTGTNTSNRVWSSKILNDWLTGKGYATTKADVGLSNVDNWTSHVTATCDGGWVTLLEMSATRRYVEMQIFDAQSGRHNMSHLIVTRTYAGLSVNVLSSNGHSNRYQEFRILQDNDRTYGNAILQVRLISSAELRVRTKEVGSISGWSSTPPITPFNEDIRTGYSVVETISNIDSSAGSMGTTGVLSAGRGIFTGGNIEAEGNITTSGFNRTGSSNSYVLLGGGSHKSVSDFAMVSGTYSGLRAQATTKADVGLGNVLNVASYSKTESDGKYLPLVGGTISGSINYNNTSGTNPMLSMSRASGGGAALARLNITGYDKGLGLSNSGDLIFGDWSGVSTLSTSWNKVYHTGNIPTWNQSTTGNAATASAVSTSAENSSTASRYILFANNASGNQALKTDSGLKYVPSTNTISATFSGNLTGNVTGNITATTGSFSSALSANRIVVTSTANEKHLEFSRSDYNYITSPGHIGFITGGKDTSSANQQVWIHSNGNTKIGAGSSTVPAYTLDVNGDVRATGTFRGSLTGNAATATKLASITTTFTGTYPVTVNVSGAIYSHTGLTFTGSTGALTATSFVGSLTGNASSATYASAVTLTADNSSNATRYPLFVDTATGNKSPRTDTGFTYNPSTGALTSTSFVGSLTGNASSASSATTSNRLNVPDTRSVDSLPSSIPSKTITAFFKTNAIVNAPPVTTGSSYAHILNMNGYNSGNTGGGGHTTQLAFGDSLAIRQSTSTTAWGAWTRLALVTDNVASATKLQTARTLTIGSKGKTFDGSANVSWTLAEIGAAPASHTHNYLPLGGGTLSGSLIINGGATSLSLIRTASSNANILFRAVGGEVYVGKGKDSDFVVGSGADLGSTSNQWMKVNSSGVTASTFVGALSGNASSATTASKLTINSSASTSWYNILWNSGTTVYGAASNKLRVQPSTGSITSGGTITASGGNSTQWNSAYGWGNHSSVGYVKGGGHFKAIDIPQTSTGSYLERVVLLLPHVSTNTSHTNFINGEITALKEGGNVVDFFKIRGNCVWNSNLMQIESSGQRSNHKLVTCMYNGVKWIALKIGYTANPHISFRFYGNHNASSALDVHNDALRVISYYNVSSATALVEEINSSIADFTPNFDSFLNGNKLWHSGNLANGTTAQYIRGDGSLATYANTTYSAGTGLTLSGTQFSLPITVSGSGTYVQSVAHHTNGNGITVTLGTPPNTNTTYSTLSVADGKAGTATAARTVRADYLKQIIQHYNVDTNSVTGIRAGASQTNANSAVSSNPYIKVIDDSNYRSQIRLLGGGATTVKSDASGNVTISSTNTVYTHPSSHSADMISAGTFTGIVKAQNNTSYTTKQVRNIILSTGNASASSMANGDIWIKYE